MPNQRILVISDTHAPYSHPDALKFLRAIKKEYDPDKVIHIGDEIDSHAMSYHDSDPNLFSAGEELKRAREVIWEIEDLYPKVDVIESNHGSLWYRKAKTHGIPREAIRTYEEILKTKHWKWHFDLTIRMSNGKYCYFHHAKSVNCLLTSKAMGMCAVQGHHHQLFSIQYWGNELGLYWGMQLSCMADKDSLAQAYGKNNLHRPIVGDGIIINGQPKLLPMVLDKRGKWDGEVH